VVDGSACGPRRPVVRVGSRHHRLVDRAARLINAHLAEGIGLLDSLLAALDRAVLDAFTHGRREQADEILQDFALTLPRMAMAKARALLTKSATDEMKGRYLDLQANAWGAAEKDALRAMLAPGEMLVDISHDCLWTSSERVITHEQVRNFGRPASWVNDESWAWRFVGDDEVKRVVAQNEARRLAPPPIVSAGPRDRSGQPWQFDANGQVKRRW
jgi:hypothetical protein